MEYKKIISVAGKPGLFQVISQTKNAVIAESILDKKRLAISATESISSLHNIAIFTYEEDVPLITIFKAMYEKSGQKEVISDKESGAKLTAYFSKVLPSFDEDRVYVSNIKKVIQWYNILVSNGFDFSAVEEIQEEGENDTEA